MGSNSWRCSSVTVFIFAMVLVLAPTLPCEAQTPVPPGTNPGGPLCPACVCCAPPPPGSTCCKCCASPPPPST
ncbi:hypothetical protein QN277_024158 [Acacia crassicarpa]|uniref:Uncharacterized protein n=1 Tax=Acacia crassicarpa TaxID=499986 RepID=A0AAE1MNQ9_9FABA|nr:hypothetical protein QN277_024158 [Acacia crassicarpa]